MNIFYKNIIDFIFQFVVLVFICCSCNNSKKEKHRRFNQQIISDKDIVNTASFIIDKSTPISIDLNTYFDSSINLKSIIDTIWYLPLETNDESMFGEIDKIIYSDERYFILDRYLSKNVFVFDKRGKFLFKLKNGEGPKEFLHPYDIAIDKENKKIYLFDGGLHKMLCYDLNGTFLNEKRVPLRLVSFFCTKQGGFIVNTGFSDNEHLDKIMYDQIICLDSNFIPLTAGFNFTEKDLKNDYLQIDALRNYKTKVQYAPRFNDTIFEFQNEKFLTPKYCFDFKTKEIDHTITQTNSETFFDKVKETGKYFFFGDYLESDNFLFASLTSKNKPTLSVFFNKITRRITAGKRMIFDKGFDPYFSTPILAINDTMLSFVESTKYLDTKKNIDYFESLPKSAREMIDTLKADANPVLILYKLKRK